MGILRSSCARGGWAGTVGAGASDKPGVPEDVPKPIAPPPGWAAMTPGERLVSLGRRCAAAHVELGLARACAGGSADGQLLALAVAARTLEAHRRRAKTGQATLRREAA